VPPLAKGALTAEERQALSAYEARLCDHEWTMRRDALPQCQPDPRGGVVGTVGKPALR
jgi:hypothetical protein